MNMQMLNMKINLKNTHTHLVRNEKKKLIKKEELKN